MLATLLRTLQIGLGALCLYLAYLAVVPLLSASPIRDIEQSDLRRGQPADTSPTRYAVIASRNLFKTRAAPVALDASAASELDEDHPESKLRVVLVGTMASNNPRLSIASVQDETSRETLTLRIGDDIKGAQVEKIERRRIVLSNRGKLEQVTLDDEQAKVQPRSRRSAAKRTPTRRPNRVRQRRPAPKPQPERQEPLVDPSSFVPGLDLNKERGEEIRSVNGISHLDPNGEVSGDFIGALLEPGEKTFVIVDSSGTEREVVRGDSDQ